MALTCRTMLRRFHQCDHQAATSAGHPYHWTVDLSSFDDPSDAMGFLVRLESIVNGCVTPRARDRLTVVQVLDAVTELQRDVAAALGRPRPPSPAPLTPALAARYSTAIHGSDSRHGSASSTLPPVHTGSRGHGSGKRSTGSTSGSDSGSDGGGRSHRSDWDTGSGSVAGPGRSTAPAVVEYDVAEVMHALGELGVDDDVVDYVASRIGWHGGVALEELHRHGVDSDTVRSLRGELARSSIVEHGWQVCACMFVRDVCDSVLGICVCVSESRCTSPCPRFRCYSRSLRHRM